MSKKEVSEIDKGHLKLLRDNVSKFIKDCAIKYDRKGKIILDIAPQVHEGGRPYFIESHIETLDIDKESKATYIADLCKNNGDIIEDGKFDIIICTEVLEHTLQPFNAVNEIYRLLKYNGLALISTPFNFRIHGPLPDCWRFTEHGLRELFKDFEIISLDKLEDKERFLMPIHYTMVVKKGK